MTSPCDDCPKRATCTTPCEKLERILPSMEAGRYIGERKPALVAIAEPCKSNLDRSDKRRQARAALKASLTLAPGLRRIAEAYYLHGLSQAEIAEREHLTRRRVGQLLADIRQKTAITSQSPL